MKLVEEIAVYLYFKDQSSRTPGETQDYQEAWRTIASEAKIALIRRDARRVTR